MSMDILAGMLSGVGQSYHEQQTNLMQQEIAKNKWYADQLMESSRDPRFLPQAQQRYMQGAAEIMTADPFKRGAGAKAFAKAHEDSATIHVNPGDPGYPTPPTSPEQTPPMAKPEGMPQMSALGNPSYNAPVPAPTPPPNMTHSGMWSPSETAEMAASAEGLKAGARAAGELPSKLEETRARYDAEFRTKMNQLISSLMEHGFKADVDPLTGRLSGTPMTRAELPVEKQAAITKTEAQAGAANATAAYKTAMLPYQQRAIESLIKYRGDLTDPKGPIMQMKAAQLRVAQQRAQTLMSDPVNSPEAMNELADLVHNNPKLYEKFTGKAAEKIALALNRKGYTPPGKVNNALEIQESAANLALDAAQEIRNIMQQFPNAFGPMAGRLGLTEQEWGSPIYPKDSAEGQAEQQLRTTMTYLLGHEGKALYGGRTPQQFLEKMEESSPNPKQAAEFLEGSLAAVEKNANEVIKEANRVRYGGGGSSVRAAAPNAPPNTQTAPQHKVGDIISYKGQQREITKLYPDGTMDTKPVEKKK
jgi:hypothetical protein